MSFFVWVLSILAVMGLVFFIEWAIKTYMSWPFEE